jgi:RNA polymerase sigma-54 factor
MAGMRQSLQQKLTQKLSPQQIQLMKMLQIPTMELEERIKEELEINPALEEGKEEDDELQDNDDNDEFESNDENDSYEEKEPMNDADDDFDIDGDLYEYDSTPDYKLTSNNKSPDDEERDMPIALQVSFSDTLATQLGMCIFDDTEMIIAEQILGSIDDDGYLRRPMEAMINDLLFSQNIETNEDELTEILKVIQNFDPPGVGARDLKECLLLQLHRISHPDKNTLLAIQIVEDRMEEFSKKHYDKIAAYLGITMEELKDVIHEILKLNPRPGNTFTSSNKSQEHVIPDFILSNDDGEIELSLNSKNAPDLRVSKTYIDMLNEYTKDKKLRSQKGNKEAVAFVRQKLDSAKIFIDSLKQRQETLLRAMGAIVHYQKEYFLTGDAMKLKPMILKDIADKTGLDISTISRVSNSKYIQTPFGTFLIKSFFSESMTNESGEEVSNREVKKILIDCIEAEDKKNPLNDDKLMIILKEKGYSIARRTVAKYRELLGIPVARLRKEL